jgi:hypothetical protein
MSEFKWLGLVVWWPLFALWTEKEAPISVEWVPFPTPTHSLSPPKKHKFLCFLSHFICPCHRVPSLAHVNEKMGKKTHGKICFSRGHNLIICDVFWDFVSVQFDYMWCFLGLCLCAIWLYVMLFGTLFVCNLIICDFFGTLFVCNWIFGGVMIFVTIFQQWLIVQLMASFLEWRISLSENVSFNLLSILSNLVAAFFTLVESNLTSFLDSFFLPKKKHWWIGLRGIRGTYLTNK